MWFVDKIKNTVAKYSMLNAGDTVIAALSGGADSTALLHCLASPGFGLRLYAVYIDHSLRPFETPGEIDFCANLCKTVGVSFYTERISLAAGKKSNAQDALRKLRYEVLERIAIEQGAAKIAVGHNKDDQAETVLINFIRGSALAGLGGIAPCRGKIIRPLIDTTRADIEKYLIEIGTQFVTDSSNLTQKYTRNRMRLSLLPVLKTYNPNIVDTLSKNAEIIRDDNTYMERLSIKKTMTLISRKSAQKIELFLAPLQTVEKPILRRVLRTALGSVESLRGIGAVHIDDIISLIKDSPTGAVIQLPKGISAIKGYALLTITTQQRPAAVAKTYALTIPGELVVEEVGVVIRATIAGGFEKSADKQSLTVDGSRLASSLTVRGRLDGDYFFPMGFGRKKKVQDFFVDEKVPKDVRNSVPLVFSGGDLVWIAGVRGDDRFKPDDGTTRFVRLELLQMRT
ncbi:MAG: tRNA lysidine(34) synthetase TilS [Candidatus Magnetominusculus sp. LBB02]|nr:tRNA lysidine(34) synthetase TilS [Candidatus Magnetominusculus sp. LBB02]